MFLIYLKATLQIDEAAEGAFVRLESDERLSKLDNGPRTCTCELKSENPSSVLYLKSLCVFTPTYSHVGHGGGKSARRALVRPKRLFDFWMG